jgi:predicted metal-binding membrane protein
LAAYDIAPLLRATRNIRPSLLVVAMIAPMSLLALYLWSTTPSVMSPRGLCLPATGTLTRAVVFLAAWMLMTAAMMLPSAMPLLVSLDRIARNHSSRREMPVIAALAYWAVWGVVGIATWTVSAAAEAYLLPRANTQVVSWLAGACLVSAGLYGFSPLAAACLRACRRPFGFLARYWRGGSGAGMQAARIGAAYGVSCVGCCVPMLGIMFVVGMANIAIVIAMGALMTIMKTSIVGIRVAHVLSIALIGAGLAVCFGWLPFFALPLIES